jgi:hypothetical protein
MLQYVVQWASQVCIIHRHDRLANIHYATDYSSSLTPDSVIHSTASQENQPGPLAARWLWSWATAHYNGQPMDSSLWETSLFILGTRAGRGRYTSNYVLRHSLASDHIGFICHELTSGAAWSRSSHDQVMTKVLYLEGHSGSCSPACNSKCCHLHVT